MRAVIVANGILSSPQDVRAALLPKDLLIAADGGAHHFYALGIPPAVVIGDLDSISDAIRKKLESEGARFIAYPRNKDHTDLELALRYAVDQGVHEIVLFGMSGGRLDQTLANLLVLARPEWEGVRLVAVEGRDRVYLLRSGEELTIQGQPGEIVSLVPLAQLVNRVSTSGLRWPLQDAQLEFGSTLSISNELSGSQAKITIGEGHLFVIHRIFGSQS